MTGGSAHVRGHIILVGLPGAGKTTAGTLLARRLDAPFVDFDAEIERRARISIADIFRRHGESRFRSLESELTKEVMRNEPSVLSPGGGWIVNQANVALVRPLSRIIHLRVGVDVALARLGTRTDHRPLLSGGDARAALEAILEARSAAYATADAEVATELLTPQQVTDSLVELVERWGWPPG